MRSEDQNMSEASVTDIRSGINHINQAWTNLSRGWQAVCLALLLVLVVILGQPIPW